MSISDKQVVQFHYRLLDETGVELESSHSESAIAYLHGYNNIFPGLETAISDRNPGESFSVTLTPEEAYGFRDEAAVKRVSVKHLLGGSHWKPGMLGRLKTDHGEKQVRILKVGRFMADVDLNHPYAGKNLTFEIELLSVRDATDEELSHGHAHGVGGHQH